MEPISSYSGYQASSYSCHGLASWQGYHISSRDMPSSALNSTIRHVTYFHFPIPPLRSQPQASAWTYQLFHVPHPIILNTCVDSTSLVRPRIKSPCGGAPTWNSCAAPQTNRLQSSENRPSPHRPPLRPSRGHCYESSAFEISFLHHSPYSFVSHLCYEADCRRWSSQWQTCWDQYACPASSIFFMIHLSGWCWHPQLLLKQSLGTIYHPGFQAIT